MQMLYACDNVRTVQYPAKLNPPPMAAFRAPGFVEGTFALECLLDELAAKLDLDPLELRRRNYAARTASTIVPSRRRTSRSATGARSRTGRGGTRCALAAPARGSTASASRPRSGTAAAARRRTRGSASARMAVRRSSPRCRTSAPARGRPWRRSRPRSSGSRSSMSRSSLGDSARGPYASISAGSSTIPSMGPAVRSAAADAKRQLLEIAAQRFHLEERVLDMKNGQIVSSDGSSWPLEEITGLLEDGQILGKGARGPNPAGMQVLTFGVQIAEVAVDVETGEVRVDKIVAIHDVGRVINSLGASSQVEGGIIQGIGHTLSEERIVDPATGSILTRTLDAYRMPTIADVPEIVTDLVDVPDPHLTNLGAKGLGEPPIIPTAAAIANAIRDATGADVRSLPITPRRDAARAARGCGAREGAPWSSCGRLAPTRRPQRSATARSPSPEGPSSSRCCATGSSGGDARRCDAVSCRAESTAPPSVPARPSPSSRSILGYRRRCARRRAWPRPHSSARWVDRRQPSASHEMLVLASRLRLLASRRRAVLCERRRTSGARDLRQ